MKIGFEALALSSVTQKSGVILFHSRSIVVYKSLQVEDYYSRCLSPIIYKEVLNWVEVQNLQEQATSLLRHPRVRNCSQPALQ